MQLGKREMAAHAQPRSAAEGQVAIGGQRGLRIGGDYLREMAEEDASLQPLASLLDDGMHFSALNGCRALGRLLERLYHSPYQGALERLNQESLSLAVLVELATHLAPERAIKRTADQLRMATLPNQTLNWGHGTIKSVWKGVYRPGTRSASQCKKGGNVSGPDVLQPFACVGVDLARPFLDTP